MNHWKEFICSNNCKLLNKSKFLVSNFNYNVKILNEDKMVDVAMSLFTSATEDISNGKNVF